MNVSSLSRSLLARMSSLSAAVVEPQPVPGADEEGEGGHRGQDGNPEESYCHMKNCDMYPPKERVVDDDCPEYSEPPFDLLSGESVEFVGFSNCDYFIISNYRFFATHVQRSGFYNVPLGMIECAEVQHRKEEMLVLCKDARSFRLVFNCAQKCKIWQERLMESLRHSVQTLKSTFAFVHRAYSRDQKMKGSQQSAPDHGTALHSLKALAVGWWVTAEYHRMGMDLHNQWKITQCNDKYEVCQTYPKLFVVPHSIKDKEVKLVAKFRMLGRVPAVVWRHPTNGCVIVRSSQPQVGVLGIWRSAEDEKLLLAISHACTPFPHHLPLTHSELVYQNGGPPCAQLMDEVILNGGPGGPVQSSQVFSDSEESDMEEGGGGEEQERGDIPKLLVMDLRSYTAAMGNRAKGGGFECHEYYPNCEIQFKGLPNIHSVRKSFQQLRSVLASEDQTSFLSALEGTQWLLYLCQLLSVACEVVASLHNDACPVLVHCSDGWDRTSQIVALAELMLDPYYRTIEGFQVLVEREWLAYGHKFGDRCGHSSEDSSQRSPVFLQWLDCVHQLMRQFPCDFKFNEAFLVKLGQHCYTCLFGTFLGNSVCEREGGRVGEETLSLWSLLHADNPDFINYLYCPGINKVLHPVPHIRNMLLWKEMYGSAVLVPYKKEGKSSPNPPSKGSRSGTSSGGGVSSQQGFQIRGWDASTIPPVPVVADSAISGLTSGRREEGCDPSTEILYHNLKEPGLDRNHDDLEETLVAADARIGSINVKSDSRALDASLLEDVLFDDPDITSTSDTMTASSRATNLGLGVDGLPPATDAVHQRLLNIELQHNSKVAKLQAQLEQARSGREVEDEMEREREGVQNEGKCTPEEQTQLSSSLQSWDCVDHGDSFGVRWVPDHASSHCQACGTMFWAMTRKHHCRSCGGVFCSTCASYFCPVPNEQLFDSVRVCEKCFYKLDGHLHQKSPQLLPT